MAQQAKRRRRIAAKRRQQKAQRSRNKARGTSYRDSLVEAIRLCFPCQFFAQWALLAGIRWTPQRLFWMGMLMAWSAEQTLTDRFEAARDLLKTLFPKWALGKTYTGWYDAQKKWLAPLLPAFAKRLRKQMRQQAGKYWLREGWCAFAVDGSRVECPRTVANETLGCAGRKKTGPQLFLTTLWHMGTGLPWDFRIGPGTASERRHAEEMLADLPLQALLVADAGFTGYDFYQRILAAGHSFLLRVGANVHLLRELGFVADERQNTVYLWPDGKRDQPPLVLRLIVLKQGKKKMYLVTNVRERAALSEKAAAVLYEMRWGVEVFYRSTKQTLQRRRMLSHTPEAARCELTWTVLGMWLLGLMSVTGIIAKGRDPLKWSVAAARTQVRRHMRLALSNRRCPRSLTEGLPCAVKDDYRRTGSKKARAYPQKKKEKPPGHPKIQLPTGEQRRAAQRLMEKRPAA